MTKPPAAVVYTRANCHLCHEACDLLRQYGVRVETVDIDSQTEFQERYDTCVPVVFIDGKERFRGRVNETLLRRLLQHP